MNICVDLGCFTMAVRFLLFVWRQLSLPKQ